MLMGNMSKSDMALLFDHNEVNHITQLANEIDVGQIATSMIEEQDLEEAFMVADVGIIVNQHVEWLKHLPRVRPFYAVKCNDSNTLLKVLAKLGTGFDCASKEEISKILSLGVSPNDIVYANPIKPPSHILNAASAGVHTTTFDNESELHKMKKHNPHAKLIIRIRCDAKKAGSLLGKKFGASVSESQELLRTAKTLNLNVVGVSFHVGTECQEPQAFFRAISCAKELFDFAESKLGYKMKLLDIGGGYPGNMGISVIEFSQVINDALEQFFPPNCGVDVIAEPGRYYVASAFTLFTQIISVRKPTDDSHPTMYYVNDGIFGSLSCVKLDDQVVHPRPLNTYKPDCDKHECSIWGPTCSSRDVICSREFLPKMGVGEWLAFDNMGAYALVSGSTFNGFPLPKVHFVVSSTAWETLKNFSNTWPTDFELVIWD